MDMPIKIRAHHLLCMQGFQGYGYTDDFAEHLHAVITQCRTDPAVLVQVVDHCDAVCAGCPHQEGNICQKDNDASSRIQRMDSAILDYAGMHPGSIGSMQAMMACINRTFKAKRQLADICGDCQWSEKCTWYLSLPG